MSADFWAGYISGAVGIIIGNPLDILKVRLQAKSTSATGSPPPAPPSSSSANPTAPRTASTTTTTPVSLLRKFSTGTAAPILGYGALNALLFVSYNRSEALINQLFSSPSTSAPASATITTTVPSLWTTFTAGAIGGLATWVVSTPTELIKCRAQLAASPVSASSWAIAKKIWATEGGLRGLYFGGAVTALRDSIGYGFYFWSYELSTRWAEQWLRQGDHPPSAGAGAGGAGAGAVVDGVEAVKVLLCGGIAGIVTWASIFPLDVIKTRLQAQQVVGGLDDRDRSAPTSPRRHQDRTPLLAEPRNQTLMTATNTKRLGAVEVAREAYREAGLRVFFRGLMVCSVRAFIVNAVQWAVYEWIMLEFGQGRRHREAVAA